MFRKKKEEFDPTVFNDTKAINLNWKPLKIKQTTTYRTFDIKSKDNMCLELGISKPMRRLTFFFFLLSSFFLFFGLYLFKELGYTVLSIMLLIGLFGTLGVFYGYKNLNKKQCFDKNKGVYIKCHAFNSKLIESSFSLNSIDALQLIKKTIRGENTNLDCFELNFVFNNLKRYNLLNHCDEKSIRQQSQQLADFLEVPLWSMLDIEDKK